MDPAGFPDLLDFAGLANWHKDAEKWEPATAHTLWKQS